MQIEFNRGHLALSTNTWESQEQPCLNVKLENDYYYTFLGVNGLWDVFDTRCYFVLSYATWEGVGSTSSNVNEER